MGAPAVDPLHHKGDGWYFWDEIWIEEYGPYETLTQARRALNDYCRQMLLVDPPYPELE